MLAKRGQGPKDILRVWLKDSRVLLQILAKSLNDRKLNKLINPTNQNMKKIDKYIYNLPKEEFISLIECIEEYIYYKKSQR